MYLDKIWNPAKKPEIKREIEEGVMEHEKIVQENLKTKEDEQFEIEDIDDLLEKVSKEDLYQWYAQAMKRRDRKPLEKESFIRHFFERDNNDQAVIYGNPNKGYLLGENKFGVFIPSHFAPKTLRGGYDLFVSLGDSEEIPAILAITEDIAATISKMPSWHKLEMNKGILAFFRGELVKKEIYYNSHPDVENLMHGLLAQYMNRGY